MEKQQQQQKQQGCKDKSSTDYGKLQKELTPVASNIQALRVQGMYRPQDGALTITDRFEQ